MISQCFRNFRTAIEHDLHMLSHAYVAHLRRVKQDSSSTWINSSNMKNSAGLKMARYLVRTSIKRLLPKKTPIKETSVEHQNGELIKNLNIYPLGYKLKFQI